MKKFTLLFLILLVLVLFSILSTNSSISSASAKVPPTPTPQSIVVLRTASQTQSIYSEPASLPTKVEISEYLNGKAKKARIAHVNRKLARHLATLGISDSSAFLANPYSQSSKETLRSITDNSSSKVITEDRISGIHVANDLYLPKSLKLTGDTVIIANRIAFEGKNVSIRGPYDIFLIPIEQFVTTERKSRQVVKNYVRLDPNSIAFRENFFSENVVVRGSVSIDVTGLGNREWLDTLSSNSFVDDRTGVPGANGTSGTFQPKAANGNDSSNPIDGNCRDLGPNGRDTPNATDGIEGLLGGNAPDDATQGGPGGDIELLVPVSNPETNYLLISRGGRGGNGGPGGRGGNGGDGGNGKRGGNGASCGCVIGNGGKGGDAGAGGNGGGGGAGGDGARGGGGGTIVVRYPANFTGSISRHKDGGEGGSPGARGQGGTGGQPGTSGVGGNPGPTACGTFGTGGQSGAVKGFGQDGSESPFSGAPGERGPDGVEDVQMISGGGGDGGGGNGGGNGCIPYYWVQYISNDGGLTWEYFESWYAGCW